MPISDMIRAEFRNEAKTTRRVLEAIPEAQLAFKPHEKSMTLARLAGHVAEIPYWAANVAGQDVLHMEGNYVPFAPDNVASILETFDKNVATFDQALDGVSDEQLMTGWALQFGDKVVFQAPKIGALRGFVISHLIHHRGQLSVYLRLLDVPVPSIYGPSADDKGGF
ncbi:MAG: damage-inducible protein DinB [Thermoanaerobaculia bacterium]|nr:damage-inducible protein DinB [Thermoanaerobaculia bacterium]